MKAPKPTQGTRERKLPPTGTHVARVTGLVYLGTALSPYKTNDGKDKYMNEVRIQWELPNEKEVFKPGDDPKPFVVNKKMTLSMFKKSTLRPFVEGIIGTTLHDDEADNFDIDEILGKPCLLAIAHETGKDGSKYVAIQSASPLVRGMSCPEAFNTPKVLSFEKWDQQLFDSMPEFIRERIMASKEYREMKGMAPINKPSEEVNADDVPF